MHLKDALAKIKSVVGMPKYRIIHVVQPGDPCHWQAQERVLLCFWRNLGGPSSSATTAGKAILECLRTRVGVFVHGWATEDNVARTGTDSELSPNRRGKPRPLKGGEDVKDRC